MNTKALPRAPKQVRSLATRQKLLGATADVLVTLGYAGTTTTEVALRAGVSQGALYKHFGSKHQLLASTTAHLFERLIDRFRHAFAQSRVDGDRLGRALRELWAVFIMPELYAVLELYIAARTDESLRQALVPVLIQHRANLHVEARLLFPRAAEQHPRFEQSIDGILATMQGAAMSAAVLPEMVDDQSIAEYLERLCRRELEPYVEAVL
ncbi:MAG: TetR/AcrR family transcriptional regulator [Myxococcota bacterium]|nr:TetR/AcrR family transcriptional regulator [Myxococcota bacterium]